MLLVSGEGLLHACTSSIAYNTEAAMLVVVHKRLLEDDRQLDVLQIFRRPSVFKAM